MSDCSAYPSACNAVCLTSCKTTINNDYYCCYDTVSGLLKWQRTLIWVSVAVFIVGIIIDIAYECVKAKNKRAAKKEEAEEENNQVVLVASVPKDKAGAVKPEQEQYEQLNAPLTGQYNSEYSNQYGNEYGHDKVTPPVANEQQNYYQQPEEEESKFTTFTYEPTEYTNNVDYPTHYD